MARGYSPLGMGFEVDLFHGKVDFKVDDFPLKKSTKSRFEVEKSRF
jgi:hypothetical protein